MFCGIGSKGILSGGVGIVGVMCGGALYFRLANGLGKPLWMIPNWMHPSLLR